MILLDILPIDPDGFVRKPVPTTIEKPVVETVQDSLNTVKDSIGATKDAIADSAANTQLILDNVGATQSEVFLLLPIIVVCVALAGCLYLAYMYRKRHMAV